MGLHEIAVKLGLAYTSNQEAEMLLAKFIANKFRAAAKEFEKYVNEKPHTKTFIQCLMAVWPENNRIKFFYVEDKFLKKYFPDLCGPDHRIEITKSEMWGNSYAETGYFHGKYLNMYIVAGSIEKSGSSDQLYQNLDILISTVYHECDHIYSESKVSEADDLETSLLYFMDNAEIRAHSKQIAYLYFKEFTNSKFNYKKLKNLIETKLKNDIKFQQMLSYLELMRDPYNFKSQIQDNNDYIKNRILTGGHIITVSSLRTAFISYMNYTAYYVGYFNEHPDTEK